MNSELLKNACFTVLKKKTEKPIGNSDFAKSGDAHLTAALHIGPSVAHKNGRPYGRLPSINEKSLSPDIKTSKEFSFFQSNNESVEKRKGNSPSPGQSWIRQSPLRAINTRSYADEIDDMISKSMHAEANMLAAPYSIGPTKLEKLKQLQAIASLT